MKVSEISNQPSFGIKYLNKQSWNPKVLKTFENSALLQNLDKKYPNASVVYNKFYEEDAFGFEPMHTLVAVFKLAKNQVFRWTLSSHRSEVPEEEFMKFIKETTLADVENKSVTELTPLTTLEVKKVSKMKEFFNKIFKK